MQPFAHILDIPDSVRSAMHQVDLQHRREESKLIEDLSATVRERRLAERIPDLIEAATKAGLSLQRAIDATVLISGLSFKHCERLFYARRHRWKLSCSPVTAQ